jgi:long-subunit acyl-CoA synthetase (AMP-forming)
MTELPLISFSVVEKERLQWGSVGVLVPGIEVRVTDVETGRALPPLANGELWIRGPMVMTGRCP